jgi:Lsr2
MVRNFVLVDDLDQSPGAQTIYFTVNGQEYEIDLSEENVERFNSALREFVDAARPVTRQPTSGRGRQSRRQGSGGKRPGGYPADSFLG